MARVKKPFGTKGGYKKRKYRPVGYSRTGLPKIYPPGHDATLRAVIVK
jgi:hypothetical protein